MNTTTYATTYPELEKRINGKDAELKAEAQKKGKFLGMKNRPNTGERLEPHLGFIKSGYDELRAQVVQFIQPDMHAAKMKTNGIALEAKITETKAAVDRLKHENEIAKHELDGKVPATRHGRNWKGWVVLGLIYASEVVFNAWSFEFMGDGLLFAIMIALGITAGMYLFSRMALHCLRRARTEGWRMYVAFGLLELLATSLIVVLSQWRSATLASVGDVHVNPAVFGIINSFLFAASMLASYFFFPQKEEEDADRELRAKFEAIEKRNEQIRSLTAEKEKLEEQAREQALHHQEIMSLAHHAAERIDTLYRETVELFKSTLLMHRDDSKTPECFSEPIPALKEMFTF